AKMRRTSRRPLARPAPLAVIRPAEALIFGIVLGAAATVLLAVLVNWLSAVLAGAPLLFYVFIFTIGLQRPTPPNLLIRPPPRPSSSWAAPPGASPSWSAGRR